MDEQVACYRNKSELTHKVTAAVASWMDEAGFKPVETEVPICAGWVADLAGIISPTRTEADRLKLIPRRRRYPNGDNWKEWNEAYYALPTLMTGVVEVKVSRSDFMGDHKWGKPCPANLCWLAMPSGKFRVDELPEAWGILSYSDSGTVRMVRPARLTPIPVECQLLIVTEIAVRRDHATRYERLKRIRQMATAQRNEEISRSRLADVMRGLLRVARGQGDSIDDALRYHGIRKVPDYLRRELEELWALSTVGEAPVSHGGIRRTDGTH